MKKKVSNIMTIGTNKIKIKNRFEQSDVAETINC